MVKNTSGKLKTSSSKTTHITPIKASLHLLPIMFYYRSIIRYFVFTFRDLVRPRCTSLAYYIHSAVTGWQTPPPRAFVKNDWELNHVSISTLWQTLHNVWNAKQGRIKCWFAVHQCVTKKVDCFPNDEPCLPPPPSLLLGYHRWGTAALLTRQPCAWPFPSNQPVPHARRHPDNTLQLHQHLHQIQPGETGAKHKGASDVCRTICRSVPALLQPLPETEKGSMEDLNL